jgi:hypothetical protein
MQHLGVLNRSSRKSTEKALVWAFSDWAKTKFIDKPEVCVEFSDVLFTQREVSSDDQTFTLMDGNLLIENCDKVFSALAQKAVGYSDTSTSEDSDFWDYTIEKIKLGLFEHLFGKAALINIRTSSESHEYFDSVVKVNFVIDDVNLCIYFDINIPKILGTYIKTNVNKPSDPIVHRKLVPDKQIITVKAKLEPVSVNIQELLELSVGDMIPLNHQLQDSLVLVTSDGRLPLKAFLVKQNNHKALLIGK